MFTKRQKLALGEAIEKEVKSLNRLIKEKPLYAPIAEAQKMEYTRISTIIMESPDEVEKADPKK